MAQQPVTGFNGAQQHVTGSNGTQQHVTNFDGRAGGEKRHWLDGRLINDERQIPPTHDQQRDDGDGYRNPFSMGPATSNMGPGHVG